MEILGVSGSLLRGNQQPVWTREVPPSPVPDPNATSDSFQRLRVMRCAQMSASPESGIEVPCGTPTWA